MANMQITDEKVFKERRHFIQGLAGVGVLCALPASANVIESKIIPTPYSLVTSYNNYYEFSTNKKMVRHIAKNFQVSPWSLSISGLVKKPVELSLVDIKKLETINRTYKLRCVEGWSAIIPWQGVSLSSVLALAEPLSNARYVKFVSKFDPSQMIGQRADTLPWPYEEGLRLDEALHPLTLLATGMYGKPLTNQNGAPIRLVVPWKYGYKSIKAVTKIELVEDRPVSSWQQKSPDEYGFYANVNPNIPHPRWSQRREVLLGETKKIKTKLLNGYADQVKELYKNDALDDLN